MDGRDKRQFRHVEAGLVRAVALPGGLRVPAPSDLAGDTEDAVQRWRRWMEQVWGLPLVAESVELASPVLATRIQQVCTGAIDQPRHVRRAVVSLYRYLLRMQYRPTPFGLFAGVAPIRIGPGLMMRWGQEHRAVARVDAVWLAEVVSRLEACPALLQRLPVTADSTCFVRGGRLVLPYQQPPPASARAPGEVTVRHTRPVRTVLAVAAQPVTIGELAANLVRESPDAPAEMIEALLAELVICRILITSLRAPMTVTDPLGHLLCQLDTVGADSIEQVAPTVKVLREIHRMLARHAAVAPEARRGVRAELTKLMQTQSRVVEQPLSVDLRVDCTLTLPRQVADEAEKAADALASLTPFPSGSPAWQDYHRRFLERYGPAAPVPLLDLIDPDIGLDFPAGYRGSPLTRPVSGLSARDEQLLAVAQRAACEGVREVSLTDAILADIADRSRGPSQVPLAHLDLRFQLHAPSSTALDRGQFTLLVTGVAPAAGSTAGRFLHLLDPAERARMAALYTSLPALDGGAVRAQVSSPPLHVRTENVARAPSLWPEVISIGEHTAASDALGVADLAVTADATRLRLVTRVTGRPVEPTMLNAVELAAFTHPLARLLCELPRARAAGVGPFDWGAAARLPFLPRVRHGRSVLAPATWRIRPSDLPSPDTSAARWRHSVTAWRQRMRVPATVEVGDSDRALRLDLNRGADTALLRAELQQTGQVTLREAPEPGAYGWFDGRPHEITLAMAATNIPLRPAQPIPTTPPVVVDRNHGQLPGASRRAYLKLYGHPDRVTDILTSHLPRLQASLDATSEASCDAGVDQPLEWWFLRYADRAEHLRLRFRLPNPEAFGAIAAQVGAWAADLRQQGLLSQAQWDTYYPETGRYGTGPAMAAAETVFAADSAAVLAQLALTSHASPYPQAVLAASLVDMATSTIGDIASGMRWLLKHPPAEPVEHPDRALHQAAIRLATPHDGFAALRDQPGGTQLLAAWQARSKALNEYRTQLTHPGQPRPADVLASLIHLHHLRMIGVDPASERLCYRLARSAALTWAARHEGGRR